MESEFSVYYKNKGKTSTENQNSRRTSLLQRQKNQRSKKIDDTRKIEISEDFESSDEDQVTNYPYRKCSRSARRNFSYNLQMSEWLEDSDSIQAENWFLVPCVKGIRCLMIRPNKPNKPTKVFYKDHHFFMKLRTTLPPNTILDCFWDSGTKTFFILDVLAYNGADLRDCECQFRFFWIKSKIAEDNIRVIDDSIRFESFVYYDMENLEQASACLENYPMFENNEPELDGLLFYHKESHYVGGKTPLVLWLFPFMLPELFPEHHFLIDPMYEKQRPENYTNYQDYIKAFNEKLALKKKGRKSGSKMDFEESEEIVEQSEQLELEELE
jgi:snurportin-1